MARAARLYTLHAARVRRYLAALVLVESGALTVVVVTVVAAASTGV